MVKSLWCWCSATQLCLTLWDPMDYSAPGSLSWDFPGKNTGVDYHSCLQGFFLTQGSNTHSLSLLYWVGRFFTTEPPGKDYTAGILINIFKMWFKKNLRKFSGQVWKVLSISSPKWKHEYKHKSLTLFSEIF